jgi:hypothetical protein
LSGIVKDKSGAVVGGASVKVINQASGDIRKTITTREGVFSVPGLRAGTYRVSATAKNFGTIDVTDIVLNALDAKSVNLELPLATVTADVVVSARNDSSIIEEDSGAKSETITVDDLQNMTMGSRNAAEVVKLMSGASMTSSDGTNRPGNTSLIGMNSFTPAGTASGLGGTQINGQAIDLTMDGGHDFDPGSPGANTPVNPNMDMISELKVLSSSFSAEYDHGPVVVNVETKGGGSQYHGQVHFYAQNSALNSVESLVKSSHLQNPQSYQYYPGAQISGPVSIGKYKKFKDKLFFFDGFESYRQLVNPGVMEAVVPTAAMYTGDFSAASSPNLKHVGNLAPYTSQNSSGTWVTNDTPRFDKTQPYATQTYNTALAGCSITTAPNNPTQDQVNAAGVLSSACISPVGQNVLKAYFAGAQPNVDPATHNGWNFMQQITPQLNQWQNVARVDWSISDNTKLYVRSSESRESANNPMGVWGTTTGDEIIPAPTMDIANNTADDISGALTEVFSPTLTSETTVTWTRITMPNKPGDPSKVSRSAIGLPESVFGADLTPTLTSWSSNFPNLGPQGYYMHKPLGMMANKLMPSAKENVTKVIGAHTLKTGAYYEFISNKQDNYGGWGGTLPVSEGWDQDTGNAYATMLMGIVPVEYDESQATPVIGNAAQQLRFYINDHWKVNNRLTIDLGVRLDHMGKPYTTGMNGKNGLAVWNENLYNNNADAVNEHSGVSWHGLDASIPRSGVPTRFLFYSPRFGLAYDLLGTGKTIVRGGFGTFYAYDKIVNDQYTGAELTAFGAASLTCPYASCPVYESLSGTSNSFLQPYAAHTIPAGIAAGRQSVSTIDPHEDQQPYVTTYNLQIDQKLPWKFLLETSYVGNFGDGNQYQADINAPQVGRISQAEHLLCLNTTVASKKCDFNAGSDSTGVYWRPRINYTTINESIIAGKTQYDGLQISAHRAGRILYLLTNFTWAKSYSNAAVANGGSYSSLADRGDSEYWGVSPQNRKFTYNAAYTVTEPYVNVKNPILRRTVNDWQISGVTQYSSGNNLIGDGTGINFNYQWGNDSTVVNTTNPSTGVVSTTTTVTATHDNIALIGANQATIFATVTCDPRMHKRVAGGVQFLNPNCFTPTTAGLGSSHPGYFPGPAYVNSDLSVMKTVKITERQQVQFKFQAFNFLNHPLWSFSNKDTNLNLTFDGQTTTITDGGAPVITHAPVNGKAPLDTSSTNFGVATQRFGHRSIQMEARYWF